METSRTINVPESVNVSIDKANISISGSLGKIERELWYPNVSISKLDNKIIVKAEVPRKEQCAVVGTYAAHLNNMIVGVNKGFEYKMKVVYSHFPIQLKVEGNKLSIGNFLGEKKSRKANILGDTKVTVKGDEVIVNGINREHVGQTAANIQQATKIRRYDPRVFQDGVYVVERSER